jgi:hypothetical protein
MIERNGDHLAEDVAALLDWIRRRVADRPEERRSEAAANILLNALLSVLEEVRRTAPETYGAYVRMSVLMLGDD